MDTSPVVSWGWDWAWGLPLIVLTVVIHAYGLGVGNKRVMAALNSDGQSRKYSPITIFVVVMGLTSLWATLLHGFEGLVWAASYRLIGARPDNSSAILYSLEAMTSYGHENLYLSQHWQLMGSLEALNGWILFGLTTAFLFSIMQRAWPRHMVRSSEAE